MTELTTNTVPAALVRANLPEMCASTNNTKE